MTATRDNQAQSVASLAAEAVAQDPHLQTRVKKMVEKIVSQVEWTLTFGSSQDKAALMKAVVPAMIRSMTTVETGQQQQAQQAAYDRIRVAVGGEE